MPLRSEFNATSFKKNPNQSCPKKMINKYTNWLDVPFKQMPWRKHKHDINIFWGKNVFLKRNKQISLFKKLWNELFLATLEFCPLYIEHKKVKFMAIHFCGRTNVKYFMQTQLLRFCKDTAKVSSLKNNY